MKRPDGSSANACGIPVDERRRADLRQAAGRRVDRVGGHVLGDAREHVRVGAGGVEEHALRLGPGGDVRARAERAGRRVDVEDRDVVGHLVDHVDGEPLGLAVRLLKPDRARRRDVVSVRPQVAGRGVDR
jgi:hypothetical protein